MLYSILFAELTNINPDPMGEPWIVGGVSNLTEEQAEFVSRIQILPEPENWDADKSFLASVDNSTRQFFRPVFNQEGFGSCGQASGIGYGFTYEMNSKRNTSAAIDSSIPQSEWYQQENSHNWYPPHFTYNFLNEGTYSQGSWFFEGWDIVKQMGIPDVHTYGGMWPTEIAEPYEDTSDYKLKNAQMWMNGYEKYKSGMVNRVLDYYYIPVNTPSGLNLLKQWMNDHCDGSDNGGVAVFAGGFPSWGGNEEFNMVTIVGLPGEGVRYSVITHWGHDEANHAMTFVGYDDEFEWDYDREIYIDNQGIEHVIPPSNHEWEWDSVTETLIQTTEKPMSEWEVGALIMVNSWGRSWGVGGKAFVPYRLLGL
jgi:hypothetical protein